MKVKDLIQELIKLNLQGYGESEVLIDPNLSPIARISTFIGEDGADAVWLR